MAIKIKLTSEQKQKGHFLRNRELVLYIDGLRHDEHISYEVRVKCLKEAIKRFDHDLQEAADKFKHHKFGAYLWLFTPDFIRGEEISGLFRIFYLLQIIDFLLKNEEVNQVDIEAVLHPWVKEQLKEKAPNIYYNRFAIMLNIFHQFLQNAKDIYKTYSFNFRMLVSKSNNPFDGTLIDTSSNYSKNRYDDIDKVSDIFKKVKYYSGDQLAVKGIDSGKAVVFKRELNIKILILSFISSLNIIRFLNSHKSEIPATLYYNHKGFYKMILYWDLVMAQKSIDSYLSKSKINYIVQVSTLTKPLYRSLMMLAKQHGIKYFQVASRSLTKLRNSERLLKCDVEEYNQTALPDAYIFKDRNSRKILNNYPKLMKKSYVGTRFMMNNPVYKNNEKKPVALFLLFNHRSDVSKKLLKAVIKTKSYELCDTIIYRCHPSFIFNIKTIRNAFPGKQIIDNTGQDYNVLNDYRILAVSGPTSAALEAVSYGSVVHWASYVYDDAILMDEVMSIIGIKCPDNQKLEQSLLQLFADSNMFLKKLLNDKQNISKYFHTQNLISEQIRNILN